MCRGVLLESGSWRGSSGRLDWSAFGLGRRAREWLVVPSGVAYVMIGLVDAVMDAWFRE